MHVCILNPEGHLGEQIVIYSRLHMELGVYHKLSIPDKTHIWVIDYLISHGAKYIVHIWLMSLSLVKDRNGQMGQKPRVATPASKNSYPISDQNLQFSLSYMYLSPML